MRELEEVGRTADALRSDLETAFVRGLATSTPNDRRGLVVRTEEWERVGAHHVSSRLRAALRAADTDAKDVSSRFLSAYTSLHAFERVLSLEIARNAWATYLAMRDSREDEEHEASEAPPAGLAPPPASAAPPAPVSIENPGAASKLAGDLAALVEDLVRTGLTSATAATRTKLDAAFKEASRQKLLRLGASLRYVNEEVGRFLADDGTFASRRYAFFLHRSWLLAKGILFALAKDDVRLLGALTVGASSAPNPVGPLEVVTVGVNKRTAATVCTFDFRLRVTKSKSKALVGKSLVFSLVFARKPGVVADAYLHLPQPQKFAPKIFRDKTTLAITDAALLADAHGAGGGRLVLGPKSTVTPGKAWDAWEKCYGWDPDGAAARVAAHALSPLDLAVEMQEEVVLDQWQLATPGGADDPPQLVAPGLAMTVSLPQGDDGKDLREKLATGARKKPRPRLFGTVHYEFGRLVFAPLSFLTEDGPEYLLLSDENVKLSALLGSLDLGK
jgi:hypothetical protein